MPAVGFVEQQDARMQRQRPGNFDATPVCVRQAVGQLLQTRQQPLAETRDDLAHFGTQGFILTAQRRRAEQCARQFRYRTDHRPTGTRGAQAGMSAHQHVVQHAQIAEHAPVLERARQSEPRKYIRLNAGDIAAVELHATVIGLIQAGNQIEQRRLARTVWANHAHELASGDRQVDRVHCSQAVEAPRHAAHLEKVLGHGVLRHTVPSRPCGRNRTSSNSTTP
jgi:hypothetical protein